MLNKEICQECHNNVALLFQDDVWLWNTYDDERWEQREVHCLKFITGVAQIVCTDRIPDECRYLLEQMMVNDEDIRD